MTRLALLTSVAIAHATHAQPADMVFVNGRVYTADRHDRVASAFAVRGNRFVAVGSDRIVRRLAGPHSRVIDLKGRFVSPGLGDAHLHNEGGGPGLDLSSTRSIADILGAVSRAVRAAGPDTLIVSNADWHEAQLKEQRVPSLSELDGVAPATPVVLVRGGHSMFLNSAALNRFGITKETPVPAGGKISHTEQGVLTGEIVDTARDLVRLPAPPPLSEQDLVRTQEKLNSYGLTAVRIPGFYRGDLKTAYTLMRGMANAAKLTLRYTLYLPGMNLQSGEEARRLVDSWRATVGDGDAWARVDGIKIMVDGGFEGGHLLEPYAEPYGKSGTYRGIETIAPQRFRDIVTTINAMGWRPTVHAVGDAALAEVLAGFAAADARSSIRKKRWTIEHASLTTPAMIGAMKRLGVQVSMQDHMYLAGPIVERYWGSSRAQRNTPLASYLRAGLLVAGGTDAPVIPANPFWELYFFASRDTISGRKYGEAESVRQRAELLRLITINFARLIGEEKERGSIEKGKLADFVVLSADFLTVDQQSIKDMVALETYVDGRRVYHNPAYD